MKKTRTFQLNKLVRDNIVKFNLERGAVVDYEQLEGNKLTNALIEKIVEESKELLATGVSAEEIADIKEVLDQICENLGISKTQLKTLQNKKREKNGGFREGHFIEKITLPADNEWAKYYASDPKRFPEIKG